MQYIYATHKERVFNMKKGRISLLEKAAIQFGLQDGKTVSEIAKELDRSESVVNKTIDEYDELLNFIVKAKMEDVEEPSDGKNRYSSSDVIFKYAEFNNKYKVVTHETIFISVLKKLEYEGMSKNDISKILNKALSKALKNNVKLQTEQALYGACIKEMRAGDFIIKKTSGGNTGVAVMTGEASTRKDKPVTAKKKDPEYIYRPFKS